MSETDHKMSETDHRMSASDHRMSPSDHRMSGTEDTTTAKDNGMSDTEKSEKLIGVIIGMWCKMSSRSL